MHRQTIYQSQRTGKLIWQKVYDTTLSYDDIYDLIVNNGLFTDIINNNGVITCSIKQSPVDFKSMGIVGVLFLSTSQHMTSRDSLLFK